MEGSTEMDGGAGYQSPRDSVSSVGADTGTISPYYAPAAASPSRVAAGPQGSTGGLGLISPALTGAAVTVATDGAAHHVGQQAVKQVKHTQLQEYQSQVSRMVVYHPTSSCAARVPRLRDVRRSASAVA